jgi:hypothetical protein
LDKIAGIEERECTSAKKVSQAANIVKVNKELASLPFYKGRQ